MADKFNDILLSEKPVLVDFFATWCGPCQYQGPILEEVAKDLGEHARILKVDVDKNPAIAAKYGIRGVPTLILFRQGEVLWRSSGVKSREELLQLIRQHSA